MKRYPDIDYSYRPVSYWHDETPAQAILKNIKGDFRREEIRKALAKGELEEIPQEILRDTISEKLRKATGRIHPRFMGGESPPTTICGTNYADRNPRHPHPPEALDAGPRGARLGHFPIHRRSRQEPSVHARRDCQCSGIPAQTRTRIAGINVL